MEEPQEIEEAEEDDLGNDAGGDGPGPRSLATAAHFASHIFLLVRTDPTVSKYKGITCLLVPMNTPGITISPIDAPTSTNVHSMPADPKTRSNRMWVSGSFHMPPTRRQ